MIDIDTLEQQAVDAAVAQQWIEAVALNEKILEIDHDNIGATLRLGFAYLQQEKIKDAQKYYQRALKIQPRNPVASENLERLSILQESGSKNPIKVKANLDPNMFLEIPGKTKSVPLVNLGQKNHLAELDIGERIEIKLRKRKIEARTLTNDFIGYLPDDVSKRLIFFMEADSEYTAHVKEANSTKVVVFVREERKGSKVAHYSSFPSKATVLPTPRDNDDEDEETEDEEEDEWAKIVRSTENEEEAKTDYSIDREEEEESEE